MRELFRRAQIAMAKGHVGSLSSGDRKGHPHQLCRHVGKARGFRIKGKAGRVLKTLDPSLEPRFIEDDFIAPGLSPSGLHRPGGIARAGCPGA